MEYLAKKHWQATIIYTIAIETWVFFEGRHIGIVEYTEVSSFIEFFQLELLGLIF